MPEGGAPVPPLITLTTDFGPGHYVAQMKGVILSRTPEARLLDVTHEVAPGDIREAAYLLSVCVPTFPRDSIHVAVVDPGVGTARRALVVRWDRRILVGPDNGIFTAFLPRADEVREIRERGLMRAEVSATFHGRDVFAPVAAHLAAGSAPEEVGPLLRAPPVLLDDLTASGSRGVVLSVDRFGNVITSFPAAVLTERPDATLRAGERTVRVRARTFGEAPVGEPFLYAGSGGRLEVALRDGSAAALLLWGRAAELVWEEEES